MTDPFDLASLPAPPKKAEDGKNTPLKLAGTARKRMVKIVAKGMAFKKAKRKLE